MSLPSLPPPIQGKEDARSLFYATRRFCARKGIDVRDPEYGSAIGFGVAKAILGHRPGQGRAKLVNYCILCALRECSHVREQLKRWHRGNVELDEVDPFWFELAELVGPAPLEPTPLAVCDFEVLSFVAAQNGHIARAARLLGMTRYRLQEVLFAIADRLAAARA